MILNIAETDVALAKINAIDTPFLDSGSTGTPASVDFFCNLSERELVLASSRISGNTSAKNASAFALVACAPR